MRIVFMGTPDFAAVQLEALIKAGREVVAVITQPDKPKGRGYDLAPTPVKVMAQMYELPVFQPERARGKAFMRLLSELAPEVIVVSAYGKILPSSVLEFPKYGCINVHASLLPKYRGAAPIQRAIIDGERESGITIMQMDEGVDTGDMLERVSTPISEDDNFETLHDRLADLGASALLSTLDRIERGEVEPVKQVGEGCYAEKIEKKDCIIDFSADPIALAFRIRGLSPIPLAYCRHNGRILKITDALGISADTSKYSFGEVISLEDGEISVACKGGILKIRGVLPEGKRRMSAEDYIHGRRIAVGDILEIAE